MNVIEQLTQVIGEESALLLGNYMGGARLYIPVKVQHDHPITMLLGREKSQMLSDYFKGDTIDIPSKVKFRQIRDAAIRKDHKAGMRANDIAVKYGISRRRVFGIVGAE